MGSVWTRGMIQGGRRRGGGVIDRFSTTPGVSHLHPLLEFCSNPIQLLGVKH